MPIKCADEGWCKSCFRFIFIVGVAAFILWLCLRTSEPKCYIGAFYASTPKKTLNSTSNSSTISIIFMVEFDNVNKVKGIWYDNVNLAIGIFLDWNRTSPIGSSTIDGFYQGNHKKAKTWGNLEADDGGLNQTAKVEGKTYFWVSFETTVKYKILMWYTKRHSLWGGANVAVDDDSGQKVQKKDIRLGHSLPMIVSTASKLTGRYCTLLALGLFVNFSFLGLFV